MGDKVIRINSVQGFADSFTNTVQSTILNLCDFVIPKGLTVDLGKSYIAFNTQINSAETLAASGVGAYNNNLFIDVDNAECSNDEDKAYLKKIEERYGGKDDVNNIIRGEVTQAAKKIQGERRSVETTTSSYVEEKVETRSVEQKQNTADKKQ